MAILIFKLRFVPEDEAQEIRELLSENGIDYYETSAGILGMSMPGLWLKDKAQLEQARQLIDQYQQHRLQQARRELSEQERPKTLYDMFRQNPLRFLGYLFVMAILLYFTVGIFFHLA